MNKRYILPALTIALMMLIPTVMAQGNQIQAIPNQMTYTVATIGDLRTLDPARAYDTASGGIIFQVYETLIEQNRSRVDQFVPELADSWSVTPDGLNYTFHIRPGVTFSNGNPLTASDVEYTFERGMVRDISGGPQWMFYVPVTGGYFGSRSIVHSASGPGSYLGRAIEHMQQLGVLIENAFTSDNGAGTFKIHLAMPQGFFMQILAQSWGSIVDEQWMTRTVTFPGGAVDTFDWPGTWGATGYEWWIFNNLYRETQTTYFGSKVTPFDSPYQMMGTGPFTFASYVPGEGGHRTLLRRTDYWGGWPAGATGTARAGRYTFPSRGYIDSYVELQIGDWTSRKTGFLAGTYDSVYVPRSFMAEVWQQPGIRDRYPMEALSADALFFNFNVNGGVSGPSPNYIGSATWGTGLPANAFSNLNLRKAFLYSFNQTKFLAEQFFYEAFQCATPIIPGVAPYTREELITYHLANKKNIDLTKAEYYFKLAWGGVDSRSGVPDVAVLPEDPTKVTPGTVWTQGFTFDMTYNDGNVPRQLSGEMLRDKLFEINNKFIMGVLPVAWSHFAGDYLYSPQNPEERSIMALYAIGWQADYADADNWAKPFQYSYGDFAYCTSYSNPTGDALMEAAAAESDPELRKDMYDQVNAIYLEDVPSIMGMQALGRRWERDWVQGWYYNPIFPASNLYTIWKEALPWPDIDGNGRVEILDLSTAAIAYGSYFLAQLPPRYNPDTGWVNPSNPGYPNVKWGTYTAKWDSRADINQDQVVDITDLALMAIRFGYVAPAWPPGAT